LPVVTQVVGKILIGLAQILSELPAALALTFPPAFTAVLNAMKVFLLDIFEVFHMDCIQPLSVHVKFSVIMVVPPLAIGIIQLLRRIADARAPHEELAECRAQNKAKAAYRTFFMIFLLYPLLSRSAFHMTPTACWSLSPGETWHMDDLSIDCASATHVGFMIIGAICIVIYPIGIPVTFLFLLFRNEMPGVVHPHDTTPAPEAKHSAYEFLKKDFKKKYFYFECVNLFEKLLCSNALGAFKHPS
jgi:hypothetical protein